MDETPRHACRVCPRTDLSLTANGRVRSHAADGKRPGPENPNCPGGSDLPRDEPASSPVTASGGPNPYRAPLPTGNLPHDRHTEETQTEDDPWQMQKDPFQGPVTGITSPDNGSRTPPQTRSTHPTTAAAPDPGSTPATTATVTDAGSPSTKATSSAQTETAGTRGRTAAVTTETADAFDSATAPVQRAEQRVERDGWGRYKLIHPVTGKKQAWQRCTTFAKMLEDTFGLGKWQRRMAAKGLALRPDLLDMIATLEVKQDSQRMDLLLEQAMDAAGQKVAANQGTVCHKHTEDVDRGDSLDDVPPRYRADVTAYVKALRSAGITIVPELIERITAVPDLGVGGTLDRVVRDRHGKYRILDVKGLALTERIPTPTGWTTMGEVSVGDTVFDAYGKPCEVTLKSEVKRIGTYLVRFDDGSTVVCDSEHIWWTAAGREPGEPTPKSIGEVIRTLRNAKGSAHHRIPVTGPLDLPEVDLPIDPYLLGCWLGDGAVRGGTITKGRDLFEILEADGHALGVEQLDRRTDKCLTRTVRGLRAQLIAEGLVHNKHIPNAYLRASAGQRLRLLQGLMDTDGTWNTARSDATFYTSDKGLVMQVEELLLSLGQRPNISENWVTGYGKRVLSHRATFTPVDLNPFRLPRKADQARASQKSTTMARRRLITAVEPGPDVDTACIGVDSPTHTYLCGDRMVATHNTGNMDFGQLGICVQLAVYAAGVNTAGVYDLDTGTWQPPQSYGDSIETGPWSVPKVETDYALVAHIPVGSGTCELLKVPIDTGWEAVQTAVQVRDWRKMKRLFTPYDPEDDSSPIAAELIGPTHSGPATEAFPTQVGAPHPPSWAERFRAVESRAAAMKLYTEALAALGPGPDLNMMVAIGRDALAELETRTG
jgi:LAGLIDADG DNA endonuclease family protein